MTDERHQRVKALFEGARVRSAEDRERFLESSCDDEAMRREVLDLLEIHEQSSGFLEEPALGGSFRLPTDDGLDATSTGELPERIGHYDVIRLLGAGGMGEVYEARQENPRRSVAVKAIRPGIASPRSLRRFKHEAAVLGRLQHTGIAHVYEAGVADFVSSAGIAAPQPFFAMEFIHGETLGEYVRKTNLAIRKRLDLFARICDAVEHAHRDRHPARLGGPYRRIAHQDLHATTTSGFTPEPCRA